MSENISTIAGVMFIRDNIRRAQKILTGDVEQFRNRDIENPDHQRTYEFWSCLSSIGTVPVNNSLNGQQKADASTANAHVRGDVKHIDAPMKKWLVEKFVFVVANYFSPDPSTVGRKAKRIPAVCYFGNKDKASRLKSAYDAFLTYMSDASEWMQSCGVHDLYPVINNLLANDATTKRVWAVHFSDDPDLTSAIALRSGADQHSPSTACARLNDVDDLTTDSDYHSDHQTYTLAVSRRTLFGDPAAGPQFTHNGFLKWLKDETSRMELLSYAAAYIAKLLRPLISLNKSGTIPERAELEIALNNLVNEEDVDDRILNWLRCVYCVLMTLFPFVERLSVRYHYSFPAKFIVRKSSGEPREFCSTLSFGTRQGLTGLERKVLSDLANTLFAAPTMEDIAFEFGASNSTHTYAASVENPTTKKKTPKS